MIIAEMLEIFLEDRYQYCARKTVDVYRAVLRPFARWAEDRPFDGQTVRDFMAVERERGLSNASVNNTFRFIKTFSRFSFDEGLTTHKPFEGPGRAKKPRKIETTREVLSDKEIIKLLKAPAPSPTSRRVRWCTTNPRRREQLQSRAAVALLVDSAIRAGELCRLTCGQVRGDAPVLVQIKGGKVGHVFITAPTRQLLQELAGLRPDDAPLFLDWKDGPLSPASLRNLIARAAKRAGVTLPPRPTHAFRHYAARALVQAGMPETAVQRVMNHTQLQTTMLYVKNARDARLEVHHSAASPITHLLEAADGPSPQRPWAKHARKRPGRRGRRAA